MVIVDKETLETYQPNQVAEMNRHIIFDFSEYGLADQGYAIVAMPNQPMFDSRYQVANVGTVTVNDGVYSSEWVLSTVDLPINELAALKVSEITEACESAITAGFNSHALGGLHYYSCDIPAQLNIQANLLAASVGRDVRHICTDINGVREIRDHSALQMIAVGESMGLHIWAQLEKANELRNDIADAIENDDVDSLIAIKW